MYPITILLLKATVKMQKEIFLENVFISNDLESRNTQSQKLREEQSRAKPITETGFYRVHLPNTVDFWPLVLQVFRSLGIEDMSKVGKGLMGIVNFPLPLLKLKPNKET